MSASTGPCGPYASDAEARTDAAEVYEAFRERGRPGVMTLLNTERLLAELDAAGVELGAYDRRIADWLAGWEPEVVQVIIGWIERAHG